MPKFINKSVIFFILVFLAGCSPTLAETITPAQLPTDVPTSLPASSELLNITWQLKSMDDVQLVAGSHITIRFEDEAMEGNTGCRGFRGAYQVYGNSISFVTFNILGEEDACQDEKLRSQETSFTDYLKSCISYKVDGERLEMYTATGETLGFKAELPEE